VDIHLQTSHARCTIAVATLLFLLIENRLVKYRDTFLGSPVAFFADLQELFVVKNAILVLETLLGDGIVVGSCFSICLP
jgi:hypothetical protein